jgi:hypothetical protein
MQPSQEIYDLFDRVCVLGEGKPLFFGPTEKALPYFQGAVSHAWSIYTRFHAIPLNPWQDWASPSHHAGQYLTFSCHLAVHSKRKCNSVMQISFKPILHQHRNLTLHSRVAITLVVACYILFIPPMVAAVEETVSALAAAFATSVDLSIVQIELQPELNKKSHDAQTPAIISPQSYERIAPHLFHVLTYHLSLGLSDPSLFQ